MGKNGSPKQTTFLHIMEIFLPGLGPTIFVGLSLMQIIQTMFSPL